MLILSRKARETIYVGDDIAITVVRIGRGRVQIGIEAPPHVRIRREEIPAELDMLAAFDRGHDCPELDDECVAPREPCPALW